MKRSRVNRKSNRRENNFTTDNEGLVGSAQAKALKKQAKEILAKVDSARVPRVEACRRNETTTQSERSTTSHSHTADTRGSSLVDASPRKDMRSRTPPLLQEPLRDAREVEVVVDPSAIVILLRASRPLQALIPLRT